MDKLKEKSYNNDCEGRDILRGLFYIDLLFG